jgi:hypothetical protein
MLNSSVKSIASVDCAAVGTTLSCPTSPHTGSDRIRTAATITAVKSGGASAHASPVFSTARRRSSTNVNPSPFEVQRSKESAQKHLRTIRAQGRLSPNALVVKTNLETTHNANLRRSDARGHLSKPRRTSAYKMVDTDVANMAEKLLRIKDDVTETYNMQLADYLRSNPSAFRAVNGDVLQCYIAGGEIRAFDPNDPLTRATYFSQIAGRTPDEHRALTQMPPPRVEDGPLTLLKVPFDKLQGVTFANAHYGQAKDSIEIIANSYPTFGKGGAKQFKAYTTEWSPSWILPWPGDAGDLADPTDPANPGEPA